MKLFLTIVAIAGALAVISVIHSSHTGEAASPIAATPVFQAAFVHPGMLHTQADFDRMRAQVNANAQPWRSGWDRLVANPHSQLSWTPRPTATIIRGGTGQNYSVLYNDIHAAYQIALRWKISGDTAYANKSIQILNAWSSTLTTVTGNADRFLAAGIYGYQFANAAEIMRTYSGWSAADFNRFKNMMLNVFYPLNHQFLIQHNDACITNYWANWDLCNMASILAIGILCDDRAKFDEAINYFKNGAGNGSINHAVPFLHSGGLGQWQESGRDQGHSTLGIGLMGAFCEMAWNQGQDMYGWSNSRFRAGAEYVARYNLGNSVPFTTYNWGSGQSCTPMSHTVISSASRGNLRPVWEMVYNHYANRLGQSVPESAAYAALHRPEGGGGDYGPNSGGYDQLGFGTLTFTRTPGGGPIANGTYKLLNRASGRYLDNLGATANGANVAQWQSSASNNQRWQITSIGGGFYKIICLTGNKRLDSLGYTGNDTTVGQWDDSTSINQQWTIQDVGGGYYKVINRANGLCLDTGGGTANGSVMEFWGSGGSFNQQWQFVAP
jgi:Alginate lyase/Ricin-type beta-trefoil lectin domain-like